MQIFTYFTLTLTALLWGGTFIAGRIVAESLPPASSSFLRFAIASVSLLGILLFTEKKLPIPQFKQWIALLFLGLTGVFGYNLFFFTGLKYITAGRASLIIAFTPLAITFLAALFTHERLNIKQIGGILISLTGALLIVSNGQPRMLFEGGFGFGEKALLGCVLSWSLYSIVGRTVMNKLSPLVAVCYSSVIGTLLLAVPAFMENLPGSLSTISSADWLSLSYLGIFGTALGFSLYYKGIKKIGPARAGIFINLVPVFALLLSWVLLGETIQPVVLLGGLFTLAGITATNLTGTKTPQSSG